MFQGIGVSDDDAGVYRDRFRRAQKCWAHLLRKAIRLALLYPRKRRYQRFLDRLVELYRDAQRVAEDGRLRDEGRKRRVAAEPASDLGSIHCSLVPAVEEIGGRVPPSMEDALDRTEPMRGSVMLVSVRLSGNIG